MTDRIEQLESALRAEDALIAEAQRLLTNYLSKQTEPADLINNLLWLFDGRSSARQNASRVKRWAKRPATCRASGPLMSPNLFSLCRLPSGPSRPARPERPVR